ncbi:hypothetical protein [Spiroplasma poulsonii]|uniref:hypothetical protein n=1 Tax=Spiroplasma poulsonii TaxID=2138 RepID=UPI001F4C96FA|nr:hypothetical protein [Spiroplasma poulsonii]UNF62533.1 hypothetical protein MNU24_03505 [Spiroplasma poulsonii]
MVKLIELSLEIDYWWLYYIDEEYQTYFHLGKSFDISEASVIVILKLNWRF